MTEDMQALVSLNKKHHIVEGLRVKPNGKEAKTIDKLNGSNIKYIFKNGSSLILTQTDLASNTEYQPVWVMQK